MVEAARDSSSIQQTANENSCNTFMPLSLNQICYPNLFLYEIAVQEFRFIIGYSVTVPANNCGKTLESSYDPLLKDNRWESAFLHKN